MRFTQEDLRHAQTPCMQDCAEYFSTFISILYDSLMETTYYGEINAKIEIKYNRSESFSHSTNFYSKNGFSGDEFNRCIVHTLSLLAAPPEILGEAFSAEFCVSGNGPSYQVSLARESFSDFLFQLALAICLKTNSKVALQSWKFGEGVIMRLSINSKQKTCKCVVINSGDPNKNWDQDEILMVASESVVEIMWESDLTGNSYPDFIELCLYTEADRINPFVPTVLSTENSSRFSRFFSSGGSFGKQRMLAENLKVNWRRYNRHPDCLDVAIDFYANLVEIGILVSRDIAYGGIIELRKLVCQSPGNSRGHEFLAMLLYQFSQSFDCRVDFADEIIHEYTVAREIDSNRTEGCVTELASFLSSIGRDHEALDALCSREFRPYIQPSHVRFLFHLRKIAELGKKIGNKDTPRCVIQESLLALRGQESQFNMVQLQDLLDELK